MSYQAMERHGKILKVYYSGQEANLKGLPTVWLQLHEIVQKDKLWNQQKEKNTHRVIYSVNNREESHSII